MMTNNKKFKTFILATIVVCIGVSSFGFRAERTTVALIAKIIQDVTTKSVAADWKKADKGEALISGDQVQTGVKSLAVVKFIDNSIVRVRERSQLTVVGLSGSPKMLSKTIELSNGAIGFEVKKQKLNEQFRFTSPTSVASIRGTMGKLSGGTGHDTLVITEGLVNFLNSSSNKDVDVPAGYIAFSNDDGTITVRQATEQELADANSAATGGSLNDLNLELRDSKGNKKELKLKFKK
jgi:hypothetical protein